MNNSLFDSMRSGRADEEERVFRRRFSRVRFLAVIDFRPRRGRKIDLTLLAPTKNARSNIAGLELSQLGSALERTLSNSVLITVERTCRLME